MQRKTLGEYISNKGSFVINGVGIDNHFGDGKFNIIVCDENPSDLISQEVDESDFHEQVWVDLRDCPKVGIWTDDCDPSSVTWFMASDFYKAEAIAIGAKENGDVWIWKIF